jgi:TatD DNase family protein
MRYFDSHAHYWDERFSENGETADRLVGSLLSGPVSGIINIGTSPETSRLASEMAKRHDRMYATAGIHPSDAYLLKLDLNSSLDEIIRCLDTPDGKYVALGEIGLDYHYEDTDKAQQAAFFDAQLAIAAERGLPVVIHDREAHGDVFDAVCRYPGLRGVIHSYSGSPELAREFARRGWYISFSGTVSFKNAARVVEAAKAVPEELLLVETDAPYLTPHPHRGKRNDSGYLLYTVAALAGYRGISPERCAAVTEANARRLFGIKTVDDE